ncbi:MAG: hypothetical protein D6702_01175 [Planctomycetota bacterium]|nr:MAG: hypothetical protein D6702_01175 [Planctomycetota bacterium]
MLTLLALTLLPLPQESEDALDWGGARVLGVELSEAQAELADGPGGAARFAEVQPGAFASRSGFRAGDLLVAVDGEPLGVDGAAALAAFRVRAAAAATGRRWKVRLLRPAVAWSAERNDEPLPAAEAAALAADLPARALAQPEGTVLVVRAARGFELIEAEFALGGGAQASSAPVPPSREFWHGRRFPRLKLEDEIGRLVAEHGLAADTADLRARLARLADRADLSRLPALSLIQRDPWLLPGWAGAAADGFSARKPGRDPVAGITTALGHAAWCLDLAEPFAGLAPARPERLRTGLTPEEQLDQIEVVLARAAELRERAFAAWSVKDRAAAADWPRLAERFADDIYLFNDPDDARRAANLRLIRLGERVDRAALLAAAAALAPLADPDWLDGLALDLERAGLDLHRPVVLRRETGWGTIAVAGTGDDRHRDEDYAVLIDLGGDDFYADNQGATVNEDGRAVFAVAALVDRSGDDAYEATHDGAQGAAVLGAALLADLAGNDRYRARRWAQGSALIGAAVLLDAGGDDDYRADLLAQGCAAWGAGLLLDRAGDDSYQARRYGQAVGLPGAVGALADAAGDDRYYAKGRDKSGYGTRGVWEGWSQGCGVGFRGNASGGLGLLLDEGGADEYEAGNFAQGGGYYFGLGALEDRGRGDDLYLGSRYNQGFAAHQAVGWFRDAGGDDTYRTRNAVASGLAWDECVTMFVEEGGDDTYDGGGFSLGASAHNSISVFWERRGADRYLRGRPGAAGGNDYHGGTSLSFFLDEGRGKDAYPGEDRNGATTVAPAHGIVVDR